MLPTDNGLKGIKKPDFWDLKNGQLAELKHISTEVSLSRAVKTHLEKARKQGASLVYLFTDAEYTLEQMKDSVARYMLSPEGKKSSFAKDGVRFYFEGRMVFSS